MMIQFYMEDIKETKKNPDATIEIIDQIKKHPNADRLDIATILGFECVTQRDLYKGSERIVYIRPDAVLPIEKWTEEYRKYSPKRIKAVRLRGEWSQGIIVPFDVLSDEIKQILESSNVGDDVGELLNVTHYERPEPQDKKAKGGLPDGIGKTDEERYENIIKRLPYGDTVDVQLKIDGQSCSFAYNVETDTFSVLGRTQELHEIFSNDYTAHIDRYDIKEKLISFCKLHNVSLCIRGESYGNGIQNSENNPHSKVQKGWCMFSVYLTKELKYAHKGHPFYFKDVAKALDLPIATMIEEDVELTSELLTKYSQNISLIAGMPFEGVVIKHPKMSFKVINKDYDSKK